METEILLTCYRFHCYSVLLELQFVFAYTAFITKFEFKLLKSVNFNCIVEPHDVTPLIKMKEVFAGFSFIHFGDAYIELQCILIGHL